MPRTLEPSTTVVVDEDIDAFFEFEDLWAIIVWNDDVTTFQTVIEAFVVSPRRRMRTVHSVKS